MPYSSQPNGSLLYELLGDLLNRILLGDENGRARLAALNGTVVELCCERPYWRLYVLIHEDGIELLDTYEGSVDARLGGPLGAILHWLLLGDPDAPGETVQVTGAAEGLHLLRELTDDLHLWRLIRRWCAEHLPLDELLTRVRREDPDLAARLTELAGRVDTANRQLARQQLNQEDILEELGGLRRDLRRARRVDLSLWTAGLVLVGLSVMRLLGGWHQAGALLLHDPLALGLLGAGLVMVAGRLIYRFR